MLTPPSPPPPCPPLRSYPSPPAIHPLSIIQRETRGGMGEAGRENVLIPVAITHRRRLVAFNKNVNMAA